MKFLVGFLVCMVCATSIYSDERVFVSGSSHGTSVVLKTGYSDVACAGGVCLVPVSSVDGFATSAVAIIPQSTAFFALSNPQTIQFRTREFIQIPNTATIVTTDSYGNQVLLNSGIQAQTAPSRGQVYFRR